MIELIQQKCETLFRLSQAPSTIIAVTTVAMIVICLAIIGNFITKKYLVRLLRLLFSKARADWTEIAISYRLISKVAHFIPAIIIYLCASFFEVKGVAYTTSIVELIKDAVTIFMLFNVGIVLHAASSTVEAIYNKYPISKRKPIKSYLQVIMVLLFIVLGFSILAVIMDTSPWTFLTGLGAATALIILVFKDSILGFVASIQAASNDMVRIGDWIEMPQFGADGDVIEISLGSIKIQNFDKTISIIPTSSILSSGIKNWRGMQDSGGRRIKRAINIDIDSISFCDQALLEKLSSIDYLKDYIKAKKNEITAFNGGHFEKDQMPINGRRLTNVGLFRAYALEYLTKNPELHGPDSKYTFMIRQLKPGELGLPLELYVFTNSIEWPVYERIQADVFDHLLAALPVFGLRAFQGLVLKK